MTTSRLSLTQRAQEAAAHIGFTVRRWWRDPTDPSLLRVEVERRLVGAPPAIAELTVPLLSPPSSQQTHSESPWPPTPSRSLPRSPHPPHRKRGNAQTRTR